MKEILFKDIEIVPELQDKILQNVNSIISERDKLAITNANKHLDTVANSISTKFEIERDVNKHPKIADYLSYAAETIANNSLKKAENVLTEKEQLINSLNEKIKAGFSNEATGKELESLKTIVQKLNSDLELTRKEKEEAIKAKDSELSTFKTKMFINASLPSEFDKTVDEYRVQGRKNEAIEKLHKEYNIITDENGETVLQKKDNYQISKLQDFFKLELTDILPKVNAGGGGIPPKGTPKILNTEGLSEDEKRKVRESYLKEKGITQFSQNFGLEMNKLIQQELGLIK